MMKLEDYIENIKFELTGGVLDLEITDEQIGNIIKKSLKEIQRYINETKFITIPFAKCIDLKNSNVDTVIQIYRTTANGDTDNKSSDTDPRYMQWITYTNGYGMYNLGDWAMNFAAYSAMQQIHQTTSTDLMFRYDKAEEKLYINVTDIPNTITLEYIPKLESVDDIQTSYWEDSLYKLSLALTKKVIGRIRTKFSQSNAIWTLDGETMLAEGVKEYDEIVTAMKTNAQVSYITD